MRPTLLAIVVTLSGCATLPWTPSTPSTVPVTCGSARWQAMGVALEQWCTTTSTTSTTHDQRVCATFVPTWSTCPADIRAASRLRDHWTDETIVMRDVGGEWLGVVFRERDGNWSVVGVDGGDIP